MIEQTMANKYGPQTEAIEALLETVKTITPEQAEALDAAWNVAHTVMRGRAKVAARDVALDAARVDIWTAALTDACSNACSAVLGALNDVILALCVKDLISSEVFHALYGPWSSVMVAQD